MSELVQHAYNNLSQHKNRLTGGLLGESPPDGDDGVGADGSEGLSSTAGFGTFAGLPTGASVTSPPVDEPPTQTALHPPHKLATHSSSAAQSIFSQGGVMQTTSLWQMPSKLRHLPWTQGVSS